MLLKVRHNVAGNNVFQQLAGSTGKGDRPVIYRFVAFTFFEGWCDKGSFPVFGEYSVLVGGSKEKSHGCTDLIGNSAQEPRSNTVRSAGLVGVEIMKQPPDSLFCNVQIRAGGYVR